MPVIITKELATAATVLAATDLPTVATFSGRNVVTVARAYRERDPQRPIVFVTDDIHRDQRRGAELSGGPEWTTTAAKAVNGVVLAPIGKEDWDGRAARHDAEIVREQLRAGLRSHGIDLPPPASRRAVTQADRDAARQRMTAFPEGRQSDADLGAAEAARAEDTLRPKGPGL